MDRKEYKKQWYLKNRKRLIKKQSKYDSYRYKTDVNYRLRNVLRSRLRKILKYKFKSGSAIRDLGCSVEEFKIYIESKFKPGMTWDNYGKWHLDHIKPLSKFKLQNRKQLVIACNYKNIQPLWAVDNLSKNDK